MAEIEQYLHDDDDLPALGQPTLTEDHIKHAMLAYLKSFYRLRPRDPRQGLLTGLDQRGEGGIVTDGFLKFTDPEGRSFFAAFEATSHDTRDEVVYQVRWEKIIWDMVATVSLTVVAAWLFLHTQDVYLVKAIGGWPTVAYVAAAWLSLGGLFVVAVRGLRRYRYIYAVEQFKQYQADEQWVAVGHDVFGAHEQELWRELRRQCVFYGFGLVTITPQRRAVLVLAPSRAEIIAKRRNIGFIPIGQLQKTLGGIADLEFLRKTSSRFGRFIRPYRQLNFRWFRRTYYHQWALLGLALLGASFATWQEYRRLPLRYVNEKAYAARLAARPSRPEPDYYLVDAPVALFGDTTFRAFTIPSEEEKFSDLVQQALLSDVSQLPQEVRLLWAVPGQYPAAYPDCGRLVVPDSGVYLLQDTLLLTLNEARGRLLDISSFGVTATAVWTGCFRGVQDGYLLYVDELYADSLPAVLARDSLQRVLQPLGAALQLKFIQ